jgi:phospholipid/cholesterol/gamma-HCH transport system permease protein
MLKKSTVINLLSVIGSESIKVCQVVGAFFLFSAEIFRSIFSGSFYYNLILKQLEVIGFYSIPVVAMTSFFSGAVLALQSYTGFSRFSAESSIATVVVLSITRELCPVLAGLMVSGRIGAAVAAEIGTMRVTEQIDALYTLATDPVRYLLVPRVIACIIALPCLVFMGDIIGILGGYCVSVYKLGFNYTIYLSNTLKYLQIIDVVSGLVKATIFGLIIGITGCYNGYYCTKGAKGVGGASTNAVVQSSIMILISNYLITLCFF